MGSGTPRRVNAELDNVLNTSILHLTVLSPSLLNHMGTKSPMAHNHKYPYQENRSFTRFSDNTQSLSASLLETASAVAESLI